MDDRTDDCAFGAMMSLALRQKFRKLRFQMIADKRIDWSDLWSDEDLNDFRAASLRRLDAEESEERH